MADNVVPGGGPIRFPSLEGPDLNDLHEASIYNLVSDQSHFVPDIRFSIPG